MSPVDRPEMDATWLVRADAVSLDHDVDAAAAAIRALPDGNAPQLSTALLNVLLRVLENGSDLDPLPPRRARPLVLAALVRLRKDLDLEGSEDVATWAHVIGRLHARSGEFANPAIVKNLNALISVLEVVGENEASAEEEPDTSGLFAPRDPVEDWVASRSERPVDERAAGDVKLLQAFRGRPLPIAFAEALYADVEAWQQPELLDWVDRSGEPIDDSVSGTAAAALLNARIREVRPRLFLSKPSSLVVQPIANTEELEGLRREVRNDILSAALSTVFDARAVLENERRRGPTATVRKGEVLKVSDTLRAMFVRLGYDERPVVGTAVPFDPVSHVGRSELELQEMVVVHRPGLWDISGERYVIAPIVGRNQDETSDGTGDEAEDQETRQ